MLALPAAWGAGSGAAPAPAPPPRNAQPQVNVGEFVVRVNQISRSRNATAIFGPETPGSVDSPAGGSGFLSMQLEVTSKIPNATLRIGGLTGDIVALDEDGVPVDIRSAYLMGAGPLVAAIVLTGSPRAPNSQELRLLTGELVVYPVAHRARLELPWPKSGEVPVAVDQGVTATLKKAAQDGAVFKLQLRIDVRDGVLGGDDPWGWSEPPLRLLDAAGHPITIGDITYQQAPADVGYREYSLELRGVSTTPSRIAVDVLARMGRPVMLPFRLAHVRLPDFNGSPEGEGAARNPYLDPQSGVPLATRVLVHGKPGTEGVVLYGLSRLEAPATWGAWRWVEVATDENGQALLEGVRPGRYRLSRQWRPQRRGDPRGIASAPPASGWINGRMEIDVARDRAPVLPILELR